LSQLYRKVWKAQPTSLSLRGLYSAIAVASTIVPVLPSLESDLGRALRQGPDTNTDIYRGLLPR